MHIKTDAMSIIGTFFFLKIFLKTGLLVSGASIKNLRFFLWQKCKILINKAFSNHKSYLYSFFFNFPFPHVLAVVQTEWFDSSWGLQAVCWQSQGRDGSGAVGVWGIPPVSEVDLTKGGQCDQSIVGGEKGGWQCGKNMISQYSGWGV